MRIKPVQNQGLLIKSGGFFYATTPHMKKSITTLLFVAIFAFSSCASFGKYGEIEYNNVIVEQINESSIAIEETTNLYKETLPDVITEKDVIEVKEMENAYASALNILEKTTDLLLIEARNIEQQNAVRTELETYRSAAQIYLESFDLMLNYYGDETYKEDITQVEIIDETLHTNYTTFIEANNDLVDILESFVASAK